MRHICARSAIEDVPKCEQKYPSLIAQAGNLAGALGRLAAQAASEKDILVPSEEYQRRLTICRGCDQYDAPKSRCKACGCAINLKARLKSETGKCPKMKW